MSSSIMFVFMLLSLCTRTTRYDILNDVLVAFCRGEQLTGFEHGK